MTNVSKGPAPAAAAPAKPKKKTPSTHPPVAKMVLAAVAGLNERGGSSVQAIKKWMQANYLVDTTKLGFHIRRALAGAVADGKLVQTKGHGASGSFKLGAAAKPKPVRKPKTVTESSAQKATKVKKPAAKAKGKAPVKKTNRKTTGKKAVAKKLPRAPTKKGVAAAPASNRKPKKLNLPVAPAAKGKTRPSRSGITPTSSSAASSS